MSTLSTTIIALALAAQLAGLESAFLAFALILLPVVYFLGLVTLGRLRQVSNEWRIYGQGMNRIHQYFLEAAPEMKRYFIMPSTDDPYASLAGVGIIRNWAGILFTAVMVVAVINSVLAGVYAWLLGSLAASGPVIPALSAAAGFSLSMTILGVQMQRFFKRDVETLPVVFPADPDGGS